MCALLSSHTSYSSQILFCSVDEALGIPYPKLAVLLAAMLTAVVVATEYFVPWTSEVSVSEFPHDNVHQILPFSFR